MSDADRLQAMTPEQREVFMCARLADDVREATAAYPGLGAWPQAWEMTSGAACDLAGILTLWARQPSGFNARVLKDAHRAYLRAWGSAATAWARAGRPS